MKMPRLFCEIEFLHKFFSSKPEFRIEDPESFNSWEKYVRFFLNDCTLILNDKNKYRNLVNEKNELFLILNKKSDGGIIDIDFDESVSDTIQTDNQSQLFFLSDATKCKKLEEDYGMFFISNETIYDYAKLLFEQSTIPIEIKGSLYKNWQFLEKFTHPCNAMIIADNYLLKNDNDLSFNLFELLHILLPKKLNKVSFQLTIITGDERSYVDVKNRYDFIQTEIQRLNREYTIELRIIGKSEGNHDRNLITNYLHICSGFGFILFRGKDHTINSKNRVLANTVLSVNSTVSRTDMKLMVNSLKRQYKQIHSEARNIGSVKIIYPEESFINRLIEI